MYALSVRLIRGYCIATVPDIRMSRDHHAGRPDLMGVVAEPSGATRSGRETARAAFQGGPMLTDLDIARLARCDRCGAEAKVRPEFTAGELLLCQHHARECGLTDPPTLTAHVTPQSEPLSSE